MTNQFKTIRTNDYWLVVNNNPTGYKKGEWCYGEPNNSEDLYRFNYHIDQYPTGNKVMGYKPIGQSKPLEGVPLLMGEPGMNVNKMAYDALDGEKTEGSTTKGEEAMFVQGFMKGHAQQKGTFTLEQLEKAVQIAREEKHTYAPPTTSYKYSSNEIIQSLQPVWEYEVEIKKDWIHSEDSEPKTTVTKGVTYLVGQWKEVKG